MNQVINKFGGLITEVEEAVNPGAVDILNWDITIEQNLEKSKGYEIIGTLEQTSRDVYFSRLSSSQVSINVKGGADHGYRLFLSGVIPDFPISLSGGSTLPSDTDRINICRQFSNKLLVWDSVVFAGGPYIYKAILNIDTDPFSNFYVALTVEGESDMNKTVKFRNISNALTGFTTGVDISDVTYNGGYFDEASDKIYAFWGNGTNSYLMTADKDDGKLSFFEGASAGLCTTWGIVKQAEFEKYNNEIIFVKGESKVIASSTGGTFVLNTASSLIELYGVENNPTGETIAVMNDRLYVGNISKQEDVSQTGGSWVQASKKYPEKTDSTEIISSGTVGTRTLIVTSSTHNFQQSEYVYIDNITQSSGTEVLNGKMWQVTGVPSTTSFYIDANTTGKVAPASGIAILRGNTWTPSYVEYEEVTQGGGIFKCDDNNDDKIIALRKNFGALFILRQKNPYVLSGDFGDGKLFRQLNIPYSTLSKSTALTANGFFFISNFGLSMVTGQMIKDNPNQFDNIGSQLPTELIKKRFKAITDKSKCILNFNNRYVWLHDQNQLYTYVFDTEQQLWTVYSGKLASEFFNVGDDIISVDKMLLFKHNVGYSSFDLNTLSYTPLSSTYKTAIYDQNSANQKEYKAIQALLQGVSSADSEVNLQFDVYYNSSATPTRSLQYNVKTGNDDTWLDLASDSETWEDVATVTDTWEDLVGSPITAVERGSVRLGSAKQIQFGFNHNSANDGRISKIVLNYDIINIGTFKSTT